MLPRFDHKTFALLLAIAVLAACAPTKPSEQDRADQQRAAEDRETPAGEQRTVVARVNGESFTLAQLEGRIDNLPPYVRTKFRGVGSKEGSGPVEKKQEYLEGLVQFELLADLAEARRLGKHSNVRHVIKESLAERLLQERLRTEFSMSDVSKAEIERAYRENRQRHRRPEKRRALIIVTESRARADRLYDQLVRSEHASVDERIEAFRRIASRASVDPESARSGGRVGAVRPPSTANQRPEIAQVVYELDERGEISSPFQHEGRWYLTMWSDKRAASTTPLAEAEREIRTNLYERRKSKLRKQMVSRWRKEATIERREGLADRLDEPGPARATRPDQIPIIPASELEQPQSSNDD